MPLAYRSECTWIQSEKSDGSCACSHEYQHKRLYLASAAPSLSACNGRASMAAANKGSKSRVRSIRFATSHDAESAQSHVHFDEKLHDSVVVVTRESDSSFLAKAGLLKILHRYEITVTLPQGTG
ncbi:unnamed protein product [Rangifer tarandus platyrhynchus]|uniref:Uncharacterized protein n=2 Tax=Rangifer tarandus platyrhynchus TaxID=3082113 RepID=A0ACB0E129_RANTA|nr:unnamed protein product [Rangifer tarandus platyrhynchus]CAI9694305.1 unnamed protein product [Rangifer tarandus platyrhynchus]